MVCAGDGCLHHQQRNTFYSLIINLKTIMKYLKWIVGIIAGASVGFAYWYFIGCNSGSCAITSSPINSTIYGGVMAVLLINAFSGNRKQNTENNSSM
jgi:Family of unknown function (DUF6132)